MPAQVHVHYEEPEDSTRKNAIDPWYKGPMLRRILIAVSVVVVALLLYYNWGRIFGPRTSGGSAVLVPGDAPDPSSGDSNSKILMDRAEVDRLRAQANSRPSASQTAEVPRSSMTAPSMDSQGALAPNGQNFGGSGRYQFYRQGNLTWRLDTDAGTACVIFATDEEWRKPKVYGHGCGNR